MKCFAGLTVFIGVSLFLVGCGGGGGVRVNRESAGKDVPAKQSLAGFSVTVQTDKATYRVGEPIQITVTATNNSSQSRTLGYSYGVALLKWGYLLAKDGKIAVYEYWTGHNLAFPAIYGTDAYAAGDSKQFTYAFPLSASQPGTVPPEFLNPGTYQVYARLPANVSNNGQFLHFDDPVPASDPVTITVTP